MTVLMEKQLVIMAVMFFCGMTAGFIDDMGVCFSGYVRRKLRKYGIILSSLVRIAVCGLAGYMITVYLYYCSYGKIGGTAIFSFGIGLWLWKKWICGKIKD